jgi:hypothetical protein
MNDYPKLRSRRGDAAGTKKSSRGLWLWTAISLMVLSAPTWADERPRATVVTLIAPVVAPSANAASVAALLGDHAAVGQGELAAQRGGSAFSVPVVAQTTPQTTPQIILWDELKKVAPAAPAGQGTNRINIQVGK